MNSSEYKKRQLKYLTYLLRCKLYEVDNILKRIDRYYGSKEELKKHKNGQPKTYKDGTLKKRLINPSYNRLKMLQSNIKSNVLNKAVFPEHIQGGAKSRSNITNAKRHQGNKYVLTTDLQNFFPSITSKQVYSMFLRLGYSNYVSNYLTKLTTYNHRLPQGTPTSTHIANLVSLEMDEQLLKLCEQNNITYSRFVDDLTFSSPSDFGPCIQRIIDIIALNNFNISWRKTEYQGNQTITGIKVFNNYIDAPDSVKEKVKEEASYRDFLGPMHDYFKRIRQTNTNVKDSTHFL
jgi:RNA-directed DNA polymerase